MWIAGPSSDARHARVSDCGPKSPEKEVECAPVVRILGIETLPNVELARLGHAPCTRGDLVEAQLRSARPRSTLAYAWAAARQRQTIASFTSENWPRSLHVRRQQLSLARSPLLCLRTLASFSLGHTRGGRTLYVSCGPSIPSPHPVTADDVSSGRIAVFIPRLPCFG